MTRSADDKAARFAEAAPIRIALPWPPTDLSPNVRQHWSKLAKAKAAYRQACAIAVRGITGRRTFVVPPGPLHLTLSFCAPTRRSYDRDNLLSRMKAGLDGVCMDALGFDDARIEAITLRSLPSVGQPGYVEMTLAMDVQKHSQPG